MKEVGRAAVYYVSADGFRYEFPTQQTYNTWYADFVAVHVFSAEALAMIPIFSKRIVYRPGLRLLKHVSSVEVYRAQLFD